MPVLPEQSFERPRVEEDLVLNRWSFTLLRPCDVVDSRGRVVDRLNACWTPRLREGETLIVIYNSCSSSVSGGRDKLCETNHITAMEY